MRRLHFFRNWSGSARVGCLLIVGGFIMILVSAGTVATAIHLENDDEFCATCHTEPEVSFVSRSQAETPIDLASAHALYESAVRCIDCHSGPGTQGRVDALQQGAQDLFAYISGDYTDPAVVENSLGDEPCFKCHIQPSRAKPVDINASPQIIASNSHYHLVEYTEAWLGVNSNLDDTCGLCHPAHNNTTLPALGFRHMPSVNATCDACHLDLSGQTP